MKRVGLLAGVVALAAAATPAAAGDPAAVMLDKAAPVFELDEVRSGETFTLEDFRGSFIVLHFGASW